MCEKKTIHTRLTHNYAYAAQAYKYKHPHWAVGGGKAYLLWIKDIPYQLPHRGAGNEGIYSNERAAFGDKPRKTKPN